MNFYQLAELADIIGILGVIFVLIGYYLLTVGKMTALSLYYQILNLVGSVFILFSLFYNWNLPSVIIEAAWITISMIGIYRVVKYTKSL